MEYFLSHVGVIFIAGLIVAVCAVTWWGLTARNEVLKRERAKHVKRLHLQSAENKKIMINSNDRELSLSFVIYS